MKIGFAWNNTDNDTPATEIAATPTVIVPRKSIVQIRFPGRGMSLSYYNDQFDLKVGDLVFVDGKLEGMRGQVTEINYNFKIRPSSYQKVIAVVDTTVKGQFYPADCYFLSFDRNSIPASKIATWFIAPHGEDDFISGTDDSFFRLDDLSGMKVNPTIAERGHDYYLNNHVEYLSIDGTHGYAIVSGTEPYEVEFEYNNGEISQLVCSCYCCYNCKHEVAAMLQLKETLSIVEDKYSDMYAEAKYFAAILKRTLLSYAVEHGENSFTL